jgi:hypothetical protein
MSKYLNSLSLKELNTIYTQYDLLKHLYPDFKIGKCKSPLRKDERPSFVSTISSYGKFFWMDMRTGDRGDLFGFIMQKENLTFPQTIDFINANLHTSVPNKTPTKELEKISKKSLFTLQVHKVPFEKKDHAYWAKFGLDEGYLKLYNISAIDWIYLNYQKPNEWIIYADPLSYVFEEFKDGKPYRKVYQPYSKNFKWFSNAEGNEVWEGWTQMKDSSLFIFEKALKDTMCVQRTTDFASANMGAESILPKKHIVDIIKNRYPNQLILSDNDYDKEENWGRILGKKLSDHTGFKQIEIPSKYEAKNYSDAIEKYGVIEARNILNSIL